MAALGTTQIVNTGALEALSAAAGGGDTFIPDARSYLIVKNGSGGSITVTLGLVTTTSPAGSAISSGGGAVAAGTTRKFGPLDPAIFNGNITYSGVTSLTVGIERL